MGHSSDGPRRCRECGSELSGGERFCGNCGASLSSGESHESRQEQRGVPQEQQGRQYESSESTSNKYPWVLVGLFYSLSAFFSGLWLHLFGFLLPFDSRFGVTVGIASVLAVTPAVLVYLKISYGTEGKNQYWMTLIAMLVSISGGSPVVAFLLFSTATFFFSLSPITGLSIGFELLFFSIIFSVSWLPGPYAGASLAPPLYNRLPQGEQRQAQQERGGRHREPSVGDEGKSGMKVLVALGGGAVVLISLLGALFVLFVVFAFTVGTIVEPPSVDADFNYTYDEADGTVTIQHTGGDSLTANKVHIRGDGLVRTCPQWHELDSSTGPHEQVERGDSITVEVTSDRYFVQLVWRSPDRLDDGGWEISDATGPNRPNTATQDVTGSCVDSYSWFGWDILDILTFGGGGATLALVVGNSLLKRRP